MKKKTKNPTKPEWITCKLKAIHEEAVDDLYQGSISCYLNQQENCNWYTKERETVLRITKV